MNLGKKCMASCCGKLLGLYDFQVYNTAHWLVGKKR